MLADQGVDPRGIEGEVHVLERNDLAVVEGNVGETQELASPRPAAGGSGVEAILRHLAVQGLAAHVQ